MKKALLVCAVVSFLAVGIVVTHELTKSAEVIPPGSSPISSGVAASTSTGAVIYPQEVIPPGS